MALLRAEALFDFEPTASVELELKVRASPTVKVTDIDTKYTYLATRVCVRGFVEV